jgi:hypothetical protein
MSRYRSTVAKVAARPVMGELVMGELVMGELVMMVMLFLSEMATRRSSRPGDHREGPDVAAFLNSP